MWSELNNYIKIPQCTRGKCECDIGSKVVKLMEEEHAHQFVMGLDDETYSTIRSQILVLDPLPPLDKIFNIIQQGENHKRLMLGRDNRAETAVAFAAREKSNAAERGPCKHCGCYGHEESGCFEIIGYPPAPPTGAHGEEDKVAEEVGVDVAASLRLVKDMEPDARLPMLP